VTKSTTVSIVFHAELTQDQVTMLLVTIDHVMGEIARATIGACPIHVFDLGDLELDWPDDKPAVPALTFGEEAP
jgi:hypothetical protein